MLEINGNYEEEKRQLLINRTVWITVIASMTFAAFNISLGSWGSVVAILPSAVFGMLAIWISRKGYLRSASILVCTSVLFAITFSIYDGDGLLDPGIVGYPIVILLGTLLLDNRITPWLTLASFLCLSLVGWLQVNGFLHITIHTNDASNLLPIFTFLTVGALIVYVILDNLQSNYRRIREREKELLASYDLTIQGLGIAVNMRDVETGNHSRRVAEQAEMLARAIGYPEKDLRFLRYGAYLHDIGKIGIPDAVLLKKGPLDANERAIMQRHCELAEEILRSIPYLRPAMDIPRCHHEHWDGNGYPNHLKGEAIPLAARIFAIVDVWDALIHDRPYRPAMSKEQARTHIAERAGTQFDPRLVARFLEMPVTPWGKGSNQGQ